MALAKNIGTAQADRYYDKDDYYTKEAAAPSAWHGKGAEALGLSGAVKPAAFKALVRGELPDGATLHRGGASRRAGTDFEFSAPKSFSIQALIVGDERLVHVHQKAVAVARQRIEATTATRVTKNGETRIEVTGKAVMAEFLHTTSRAGDPDLHSHVVALNLTQRQDGQWRSVDNTAMFREQRLMYEIYLSELAKGTRELGYETNTGKHGNPELAHISREQIEHFSSRGAAIEAALQAQGLTLETATPRQKKAATMTTRSAKQEYDREALASEWRARARELGIETALPRQVARRHDPRLTEPRAARDAVRFALLHLGEREAAFTRKEVVIVALREARGDAGYGAIEADLSRRQHRGEVLLSRDGERLTTLKALAIERRILAHERSGRGQVEAIAPADKVARHLARREMTVGQADAVRLAATSPNSVNGIQGVAGSGKTTALHTFGELVTQRGYRVVGLAPSHSATRALRESGLEAQTLQSWLADRTAAEALNARTILVVDEAGLVGNRDLLSTLERTEKSGARVLLVGDTRQYQSIAAGRAFAQLQQQGMATARMTEILRQRDGQLRQAAKLSVDQPARALRCLDVREVADPAERYRTIAQDYAGLSRAERDATLILTGTNAARVELNNAVRDALKNQGEIARAGASIEVFQRQDLTAAEQKRLDRYQLGDAVLFQKAYRSLGVQRGEIYRVSAIRGDHLIARSQDGRKISYTPARLNAKGFQLGRIEAREVAVGELLRATGTDRALGIRNGERGKVEKASGGELVLKTTSGVRKTLRTDRVLPVDYGYASTGHSAQGLSGNRVLLDKDAQARTTDHRSFYTDLTRARYAAVIYTNDRSALPEAVIRQSQKTAALDVASESARRSGERGLAHDGSAPKRSPHAGSRALVGRG